MAEPRGVSGKGSRLGEARPITEELGRTEARTETPRDRPVPASLSGLRQKLGQKAKQEPKFRLDALDDRIYRRDTLEAAWGLVRAKGGAPGVDGVRISQILAPAAGPTALVDELPAALRTTTYRPSAVRRVYLPKANGKLRPVGIPTVRDRVVQQATLLILEPIFAADFLDSSYGFRPGRNAHQALGAIRAQVQAGLTEVYDADLASYFDSSPHDKLLACLERRIAERSVLRLIRSWLEAPLVEPDQDGKPQVSRPKQGTPQGGVISPLVANLYLHWFDVVFQRPGGPGTWAGARLVRYADDCVILARHQGHRWPGWVERTSEEWLGLRINRDKTRVVNLNVTGASLDCLGYTFRDQADLHGRAKRYLNVAPSKEALQRERAKRRALLGPAAGHVPVKTLIQELNQHLLGWAGDFGYGYPRQAFRAINWYVRERRAAQLRRRSQRRSRAPQGVRVHEHLRQPGLVYL